MADITQNDVLNLFSQVSAIKNSDQFLIISASNDNTARAAKITAELVRAYLNKGFEITIGQDGHLYIGGERTEFQVAGVTPIFQHRSDGIYYSVDNGNSWEIFIYYSDFNHTVDLLGNGILPDIQVLASETGYYTDTVVDNVHQTATSGYHTPVTPIPKGYDKVMMCSRLAINKDYPIFIYYDENLQEIGVYKRGNSSTSNYLNFIIDTIPENAAYVSGSAQYLIDGAEEFDMRVFSSNASSNILHIGDVARHTRRITKYTDLIDGFYYLGSLNIGDVLDVRRVGKSYVYVNHVLTEVSYKHDWLYVKKGDKVEIKTAGTSGNARAWAFFDERMALVEMATTAVDATSTPIVKYAPKDGYLLISHRTGQSDPTPSDGIYCRINDYSENTGDYATEEELENATHVWETIQSREMRSQYINSSAVLSTGNYRIFTHCVKSGEIYRLTVTPGYNNTTVNLYKLLKTTDLGNLTSEDVAVNGPTIKSITTKTTIDITIPEGVVLLVYQGYFAEGNATMGDTGTMVSTYLPTGFKLERLTDVAHCQPHKTLKILAVGNSFTCDELSYLPFAIKSIHPDWEVRMRIVNKSGALISEYNDNKTSNTINGAGVYAYDYYDDEGRWHADYDETQSKWVNKQLTTLDASVYEEDWDIITFQQGSPSPYWNTVETPLTGLVTWLRQSKGYTGKIAWVFTHSYSDDFSGWASVFPNESWAQATSMITNKSDYHWRTVATLATAVMESGLVDMLLPCGTAIQNARHNNKLCTSSIIKQYVDGNYGDGNIHLEEGIGPLSCSYAALAAITSTALGAYINFTSAWVIPQSTSSSLKNLVNNRGFDLSSPKQVEAIRCAMDAILSPYDLRDRNENIIDITNNNTSTSGGEVNPPTPMT